MRPDVVDLNAFYQTRLGHVARRQIRQLVRATWPAISEEIVLGLGYAAPFLGLLREEAERLIAIMPPGQGVLPWPEAAPRKVALADEAELPLPDSTVDRILMIHALEYSEQVQPMLAEAWRVLRPNGRLLVLVPNRHGLWARAEATPFGHGHPFSGSQLARLLRQNQFAPLKTGAALFLPPSQSRMLLRTAGLWARVGRYLGRPFGGVVYAEATKTIYEVRTVRPAKRRRILVAVPETIPAGARAAAFLPLFEGEQEDR